MVKAMKKFVCLLIGLLVLSCGYCVRGEDSVLLWMVDMGDTAKDFADASVSTVADLVSRPGGNEVNGARVRVAGTDVYLSLYSNNEGVWQVRGEQPYNTLVTFADDGEKVQAGPSWASLGAYADASYSFMIELGHYSYDGDDNFVWEMIAFSEVANYDSLQKFRTSDIVEDPTYTPWQSTYAVPEPTSVLLFLLGGAVLALRRRRTHVRA